MQGPLGADGAMHPHAQCCWGMALSWGEIETAAAGAVLQKPDVFFLSGPPLRTAPGTTNRHQRPTATNRQPPTASGDQSPTANDCQLPPTTDHQPPTTSNRNQPPPIANRQSPLTMVEHMSYTWSVCKLPFRNSFLFFSCLEDRPGGCKVGRQHIKQHHCDRPGTPR